MSLYLTFAMCFFCYEVGLLSEMVNKQIFYKQLFIWAHLLVLSLFWPIVLALWFVKNILDRHSNG